MRWSGRVHPIFVLFLNLTGNWKQLTSSLSGPRARCLAISLLAFDYFQGTLPRAL